MANHDKTRQTQPETPNFIDEAASGVALDEAFSPPPAPEPVPVSREEFDAMRRELAAVKMASHKPDVKAIDGAAPFKLAYSEVDKFLKAPDNPFRFYKHLEHDPTEQLHMIMGIGLMIDKQEQAPAQGAWSGPPRRSKLVSLAMEEPPFMVGQDLKGHVFIMTDIVMHESCRVTEEECAALHARGYTHYEAKAGDYSIAEMMEGFRNVPKPQLAGVLNEASFKKIIKKLYDARKSNEGATADTLAAQMEGRTDAQLLSMDWSNVLTPIAATA